VTVGRWNCRGAALAGLSTKSRRSVYDACVCSVWGASACSPGQTFGDEVPRGSGSDRRLRSFMQDASPLQ
jgi:hypothetical protein